MDRDRSRPVRLLDVVRFMLIVRVTCIHDPTAQRLTTVYLHSVTLILKDTPFKDRGKVTSVVQSIVRVHQKFKLTFFVDEYLHDDFTFCDIPR
jgi:hypothetical protein